MSRRQLRLQSIFAQLLLSLKSAHSRPPTTCECTFGSRKGDAECPPQEPQQAPAVLFSANLSAEGPKCVHCCGGCTIERNAFALTFYESSVCEGKCFGCSHETSLLTARPAMPRFFVDPPSRYLGAMAGNGQIKKVLRAQTRSTTEVLVLSCNQWQPIEQTSEMISRVSCFGKCTTRAACKVFTCGRVSADFEE